MASGRSAEATERLRPGGACDVQLAQVLNEIEDISRFAVNRGDAFFRAAAAHKGRVEWLALLLVGAIFLLTGVISYHLYRAVRGPLKELTTAADRFRQGQFEARSRYPHAAAEFRSLADAFNQMVATVEAEMAVKGSVARLAEAMLREDELQAFCQAVLKIMLQQTGSQSGAIYLMNDARTQLEHFASIGLSAPARAAFSAAEREGEFGPALAARQICRTKAIPSDTRLSLAAVEGDYVPREIITIPVISNQEVVAMISLASLRDYTPEAVRLVEECWGVLSARTGAMLALQRLREYSARLDRQNKELEAQRQELDSQTRELTHQNSELEVQKRQLDEASRLKSAFLSNMSHELRTPLNSVNALAGVLRRRLAGAIPAEETGYLEVIERNGQHLLALINDILDLSRVEAGKTEIVASRFSVRELVAGVVAMVEPQAREKNLALINEVEGDLPPVIGDHARCRQILLNLVGNAVKFTERGEVRLSARPQDDAVLLVVADTGIGIAPEHLPHIFDEFRQGDSSTSRKYGGTGLGLAIAKKFATLLGGGISVESTPGRGSTFTFRLPRRAPGFPPETDVRLATLPAAPAPAPATIGHGQCILLVEDSEPAIIQMTDILTQQGYHLQLARNGQEALEQIDQIVPDAMILDLMMPEVDGFEVLRTVRAGPRTRQLPVLILTAKYVTPEELRFLQGNNIHQLIQKGDVTKEQLLAAVAQMVAPTPPAPAAAPAEVPAAGARRPVVLVIEDNADNLTTMRALLRDTCDLLESTDGRLGLDLARQHRPDLILMDLALPGMSGFETLAALRQEESLRGVPVIAVTASAMKGDRTEILARGFDDYVSKPIDEALLQAVIRDHLHAK
jgi:signal transduction histidine kinase/CheY-like chemotaxis protein